MVTKAIERAQKRVETHNFDIRKHLLEYDDVMNQQREVIYAQRLNILEGGDLKDEIAEIFDDIVEQDRRTRAHDASDIQESWDLEGLREEHEEDLPRRRRLLRRPTSSGITQEALRENLRKAADARVRAPRAGQLTPSSCDALERLVFLQVIDKHWRDHLYELDRLQRGDRPPGLRTEEPAPRVQVRGLRHVHGHDRVDPGGVGAAAVPGAGDRRRRSRPAASPKDAPSIRTRGRRRGPAPSPTSTTPAPQFGSGAPERSAARPERLPPPPAPDRRREAADADAGGGRQERPVRMEKKVGRNDPCPCGSGKKYKKCCGRDS